MRLRFVLALIALAALASANAVMGVALEQYDRRAWFFYVVLTVAFEAWAIGRWAGFAWPGAVGVSVVANLVTAGCCANLCGVGLHSTFVGSRMNPNPLANMVLMFAVFALISGGIEAIVWRLFARDKEELRDNPLFVRTVAAHVVWVPLGIAIMLAPARPYPFLEDYTVHARRFYLTKLRSALEAKIANTGRIPDYSDTARFFREVVPLDGSPEPDAWAVAYRPDFGRFATGQSRREPLFEWNPAAVGLKVDSEGMPERIWLLRVRPDNGWTFGFVWEQGVRFTNDRRSLGYAAKSVSP